MSMPSSGLTTTTITIGGMAAVHAVRAVFTALTAVPGIQTADVSLGKAIIQHDGTATHDDLRAAIDMAGCEVVSIQETRRQLPLA